MGLLAQRGPAALERTGDFLTDSVLPIIDSGQAELIGDDARAQERHLDRAGAWPHARPEDAAARLGRREALLTADLMHHPLQLRYPEWSTRFCIDPDEARRTRMNFLKANANSGRLIFPTHFPSPTGCRIERDGTAYRFMYDGEG